ncbi:MAG: type I DNA topoisomerase [bacterium]|nr:type I DNA topoisomerase [bacterium]
MEKKLVIVESPAKAKTISKYLGKDFNICASYGHIRDLPTYTLGVNLKDNFAPTYKILKDKTKLLKELNKLSNKVDSVLIATDPDREGEAIAWHIQESLDIDSTKVKRIVFYEITKKAVQKAITEPREINMRLVDAQQARRVLDRLIGYKLSPIISKKIRKGLSAGRVQSVAVKIICEREKEITAFEPKEYWIVEAELNISGSKSSINSKLFAVDNENNKLEIESEKQATEIVTRLQKADYQILNIKKSNVKKTPAPPFITSTLQQDASRKFFWSTKKTMLIAQQLYEGVEINGEATGLITYMRTDSFRVSNDAQKTAKQLIESKFGKMYTPEKQHTFKQKKMAQDAHEAIRPTYIELLPEKVSSQITNDQFKLYKLIWDRFIASQMRAAELENTQILIKAVPEKKEEIYLLKTTGYIVKFDGFTKLYSEGKDEQEKKEKERHLPTVEKGQALEKVNIISNQKFTQPPPRYSEASLIREMEEKGIGRPSTYAPTLSTIQDRGYINKEKRTLFPSELGMLVNNKLNKFFDKIIETQFTAKMETHLDEVMEGKHKWQSLISEIYEPFSDMLVKADKEMEKVNTDKPSDEVCEKCSNPMIIKTGRYGEFLACSNFPDCKNIKSIVIELDVKCPECTNPLVEKKSRKGKVFYGCSNYPKCKFALWDKPVAEKCSKCNNPYLLIKKKKNSGEIKYCDKCKS